MIFYYYIMGKLLDDEILFRKNPDRKAILPILFPDIWEQYKKLQSSTWTREEISLKDDITQISNGEIPDDIMKVIEYVLGFFSGADRIVNVNLAENFLSVIEILEVNFFYTQQMQNENVHNETYAFLIDAFYKDDVVRKNAVLNASESMPCINKLFQWCEEWIHLTPERELETNSILIQYAEQGADDEVVSDLAFIWNKAKILVAFACVEGILFSSAFCFIFWIKERGMLPGFTFSNELISTDEGLHRDFACNMYNRILHKPPEEQVRAIIMDVVEFQKEFVSEMLVKPLTNMNAELMIQYVKYTADNLATALGMAKIYNVSLPFAFMENISFNGQTNFFERRVGEYSLSGFETDDNNDIVLDDDY